MMLLEARCRHPHCVIFVIRRRGGIYLQRQESFGFLLQHQHPSYSCFLKMFGMMQLDALFRKSSHDNRFCEGFRRSGIIDSGRSIGILNHSVYNIIVCIISLSYVNCNKSEQIKLFQKINCFLGFVTMMAIQTIEMYLLSVEWFINFSNYSSHLRKRCPSV